jgi:putative transposase
MLGRFGWQEGFRAFSYSHIPVVAPYIERQEEHHRRKTFRDEYLELLVKFQIAHDERYVFKAVM